jgi:hypothetical protein
MRLAPIGFNDQRWYLRHSFRVCRIGGLALVFMDKEYPLGVGRLAELSGI